MCINMYCLMSIYISLHQHLMSICRQMVDVECLLWHCVPRLLCTNAANFTAETHWSQTDIILFTTCFWNQNCVSIHRWQIFQKQRLFDRLLQSFVAAVTVSGFRQKSWTKSKACLTFKFILTSRPFILGEYFESTWILVKHSIRNSDILLP